MRLGEEGTPARAWRRPWVISVVVFIAFAVIGSFFDQSFFADYPPGSSSLADLGWWGPVLGAGLVLPVLLVNALFHRGDGLFYCDHGVPGIDTWSAGGANAVALLLVAFTGMSLGTWVELSSAGTATTLWRADIGVGALVSTGGWLTTIGFVPTSRMIRSKLTKQLSAVHHHLVTENSVSPSVAPGPILVLADDGPSVFETIDDLERKLEPIDVYNDEYRAFDANGFPLELFTATERRGKLLGADIEVTRIGPRAGTSQESEVTREILDWLAANYPDRFREAKGPLPQLIASLIAWFGYER